MSSTGEERKKDINFQLYIQNCLTPIIWLGCILQDYMYHEIWATLQNIQASRMLRRGYR